MSARPEPFLSACLVLSITLAGCSRQSEGGLAGQTYDRACAAFDRQQYERSERLALLSAEQARRSRPPDKRLTGMAFECAGLSAQKGNSAARALAHFTNAASLTDQSLDPIAWCRVQGAFASAFNQQGDHTEAERRLQRSLPIQLKVLGPEHPDTLASRHEMAYAWHEQRQYAKAEAEYRTVASARQRLLGPGHHGTLVCRMGVAVSLSRQRKYFEAESEYRAVGEIRERLLGREHPDTLASRGGIAVTLLNQSRHLEAEAEYRALLPIHERILGREHPQTLECFYNFAITQERQLHLGEATELARHAVEGGRKVLPEGSPTLKDYETLYRDLTAKK